MDISFPPELPISQRHDDLAAAIRDHQVVVVAGETGSGKTTQLPKICLELGRGPGGAGGRQGLIGHTQPRRIAARSVAERLASELGTTLGDEVGYQVRFTDKTSPATRLKVMTDGILLAELQRDRDLRRYDTILIDEAHERSLNIDFLLGYLKRLLPRRPDLKLVITSATIDPQRFAAHFSDGRGRPAPILEVSGRTYPVEIRYRPLVDRPETDEEGEAVVRDQTEAIIDAVRELSAEGPGDVLVFLPGEREIRDTADALGDLVTRTGERPARTHPRGRAVVLAALRGRAAPGLLVPPVHRAPRRARDQRRRDLADRARHPLRRRHRPRAHLALLRAYQGAAAADRGDQPGVGPAAVRALRSRRGGHRDPARTTRRTSRPGRRSPSPRSCGPTWPR